MERLTKRAENGIALLGSWADDQDSATIIQCLCDRLADYEDTGFDLSKVLVLDLTKPIKCELWNPFDRIREAHTKLLGAVQLARNHIFIADSQENRNAYDKALNELEEFEMKFGYFLHAPLAEEYNFSGRKLTDAEKRYLSGIEITTITQDQEQLKRLYDERKYRCGTVGEYESTGDTRLCPSYQVESGSEANITEEEGKGD